MSETAINLEVTNKLEKQVTELSAKLALVQENTSKVIFGQKKIIDLCLISILSGGHFLLIGLPGLGKTKLIETLGIVLGLENGRIQYTPDLMPSDILGSEVLENSATGHSFKFIKGPIFCQLLMADEINRASPRTQSALLQAMQEYKVSIGGKTYELPKPFNVMATQNPLEQEGTYPLPEAQLDRFMLQIDIEYPETKDEMKMMLETTGIYNVKPETILNVDDILSAQDIIRQLPIGQNIVDVILHLVQSGRPQQSHIDIVKKHVSWGPGPRASQAFMLAARAKALLDGRYAPSIDDIIELAPAILKHRMALNFSARAEDLDINDIITAMCKDI